MHLTTAAAALTLIDATAASPIANSESKYPETEYANAFNLIVNVTVPARDVYRVQGTTITMSLLFSGLSILPSAGSIKGK